MSERPRHNITHALGTMGLAVLVGVVLWSGCAHSPQPNLVGRIVDERGNGVAGARVTLAGRSEETVTESDGHFRFAPLPPGTYALSVRAWNQNARFQDSTRVQKGRLTEVELTLPDVAVLAEDMPPFSAAWRLAMERSSAAVGAVGRTGTIRGTVVDEIGQALPGGRVLVKDAQPEDMDITPALGGADTDSLGRYLIQGVPVGDHTVGLGMAGWGRENREHVVVSEGDTTTVDFELRTQFVKRMPVETRRGTIQGMVVSEDGGAVPYAVVTVLGAYTGNMADSSGHYLIRRVPIGVYRLRAKSNGFFPVEREHVRVAEGDTTAVDFTLRPGGPYREMKVVH